MDENPDQPTKESEGDTPAQGLTLWGAAWWGAFLIHPAVVIFVFEWGAICGFARPIIMSPYGARGPVKFGFAGGGNALLELLGFYLCFGILIVSAVGAVVGAILSLCWHRYSGADLPMPRWHWTSGAFLLLALLLAPVFWLHYSFEASHRNVSDCLNRGSMRHAQGQYDIAIAEYNQVLAESSFVSVAQHRARAYIGRARAWKAKHEHEKAIADFTEALQLEPQKFMSAAEVAALHADFAEAYAEAGQFASAIQMQKKAIDLAPAHEKHGYAARLKLYESGKLPRD